MDTADAPAHLPQDASDEYGELAVISLVLSDGQQVEVEVMPEELTTWGRVPGCVYTVFKAVGETHILVARWKVSPEGQLLSLFSQTPNIPNLVADADKLRASVLPALQS